MSNIAPDPTSRSSDAPPVNPYETRFRLPDSTAQLEGWMAELDPPASADDLPSTDELRDLLEGKIPTAEDKRAFWMRVCCLVVGLMAALYWLYMVRRYVLEMLSMT
ncbi:MAG TPA: hypothetical protein DDY91_11370 [Planctomycetaceae bacterium]|jgi:hypothetical protein|nr:hypothetical protein [Planctomycetaceae bacterium]